MLRFVSLRTQNVGHVDANGSLYDASEPSFVATDTEHWQLLGSRSGIPDTLSAHLTLALKGSRRFGHSGRAVPGDRSKVPVRVRERRIVLETQGDQQPSWHPRVLPLGAPVYRAAGPRSCGVVFPVSSVILDRISDYREVLESYSKPLLAFIEWEETESHNVQVTNRTVD